MHDSASSQDCNEPTTSRLLILAFHLPNGLHMYLYSYSRGHAFAHVEAVSRLETP